MSTQEIARGTVDIGKPLGKIGIVVTRHGLARIELNLRGREQSEVPTALRAIWVRVVRGLKTYCKSGDIPDDIPLDLKGTPFQLAVWKSLRTVPPGKVVSYRELADDAGFPRASRAVGTAMAKNPVPIVVPCHRVVRSGGNLGNYGGGVPMKRALLKHEDAL